MVEWLRVREGEIAIAPIILGGVRDAQRACEAATGLRWAELLGDLSRGRPSDADQGESERGSPVLSGAPATWALRTSSDDFARDEPRGASDAASGAPLLPQRAPERSSDFSQQAGLP